METRLKVYLHTQNSVADDYVAIHNYDDVDYTGIMFDDWDIELFAFGQPDKASFTLYDKTGALSVRALSYQRVYLELWDPEVDPIDPVRLMFGGRITEVGGSTVGGVTAKFECRALGWMYEMEDFLVTNQYKEVSDTLLLRGGVPNKPPPLNVYNYSIFDRVERGDPQIIVANYNPPPN